MQRWQDVTFADPVVLMSLDGRIVWVNDLFTDLMGFDLDEMLARPKFSLMDPEDAEAIASALPDTFQSGQSTAPLRINLTAKSGAMVNASVAVRPRLVDGEEPVLVVSLRKSEDHWESVITELVGDSPIDATMQSIADALGVYDVAVVLTIATEDGRRQFSSNRVPAELLPAIVHLDNLLDEGGLPQDGSPIVWADVAGLAVDDLTLLHAHGFGVAVVTTIDDPSGMGPGRYIFLFETEAQTMRMRWMTAHRPQEYFSLALLARHRRRELVYAATHDPLTGLPNRARFFGRITELGSGPVGLLFVDLDGFKPINDEFGHSAGDQVLIEVARRLRLSIRDDDLAARVGGDEFGVVCADVIDVEVLTELAERLVRKVAEPISVGDRTIRIGASIGVAMGHTFDGVDLVEAADAAMYVAKTSGKSRWSMTKL